jgi:hypothetical protein
MKIEVGRLYGGNVAVRRVLAISDGIVEWVHVDPDGLPYPDEPRRCKRNTFRKWATRDLTDHYRGVSADSDGHAASG